MNLKRKHLIADDSSDEDIRVYSSVFRRRHAPPVPPTKKWQLAPIEARQFNLNLGVLCLGSACIGLALGWPETTSTYYIIIECTESCYDLSSDGSSTIHLVVNLGACLGALVPACLVDILGRRHNFAIAAVATILFWLILGIARDNIGLILGTAIGGFAAGLFVVTSTMYVAEIARADQRGTIGALVAFFAYFGILISTCCSTFLNHRFAPFFMCLTSICFLLVIYIWMIESPYFLYESGRTLEAKLALKALRGVRHVLDVDLEYKSMQCFFESNLQSQSKSNILQLAFEFSERRLPATVTMVLLCVSQMVGGYAMSHYTGLFMDSVLPHFAKIIMATLDVVSIAICVYLIEKLGRKPLLMFSIAGSSVCCLILAVESIVHQAHNGHLIYPGERIFTLIIVLLYYGAYSLGITPILPVLTGEVFSSRVKTIAIGIAVSMYYLAAMVNQAIFEFLNVKKGSSIAFLSFTVVGSLGLVFVLIFLPETRNKTLHQIQQELDECPFITT